VSETPKAKNPLGPTGVLAAARVRELREARGLSYAELSARLTAAGRPIPPLGLRRIESQDRRIDADDLVALAAVLGVNPSALLLPLRSHGQVEITGVGGVDAARAWSWMDGGGPLGDDEDGADGVHFADHARPPDRRRFSWSTRAGRERIGTQYDGLPDATVIRDPSGDVTEVRLPGGGILSAPRRADGGDDDGR
jgi:transcriptional regulator with XRE-family HTH domain